MHLFVIEHYTNLDSLAPVIYKLALNNQKIYVCGTHPVKIYKNDKLVNFLEKIENKIVYKDLLPLGFKENIILSIINLISLLPKKIICGKSIWTKIAKKINLINKAKIRNFIKEKNHLYFN